MSTPDAGHSDGPWHGLSEQAANASRAAFDLLSRGLERRQRWLADGLRMASLASWASGRLWSGLVLPSWRTLTEVDHQVAMAWLRSWFPGNAGEATGHTIGDRFAAGLRYAQLVADLGGALFGTARWPGETVLGEDAFFRLSYIPATAAGAAADAIGTAATDTPDTPPPIALFHLGGVLPYGDRLFRLLPEVNFYDRFLERGIPVYALELRGDARILDYRELTLGRVFEAIDRHGAAAAAHAATQPSGHANGDGSVGAARRLVLEGYCGLASQALAYVATHPEAADQRFAALALFVGPVDGTRCQTLAEPMRLLPDDLLAAAYSAAAATDGYVSGDSLRLSQDLALETLFLKTPLGAFAAGFQQPELAHVQRLEDLTPPMRKTLAGAFWVSPENGRRWPVPLDLSRFSTALFSTGVAADGAVAFAVGAQPLTLAGLKRARMPVIGFYGGKDVLVPEATAEPLYRLLGDRYTHVVHPQAGHISYIFSTGQWRPGPKALDPNPIDVLLARVGC